MKDVKIIDKGNKNHHSMLPFFLRGDRILAVATMGPGNAAAKAANEMFDGKMPSATQIRLGNTFNKAIALFLLKPC